jgi:hypothetical protein
MKTYPKIEYHNKGIFGDTVYAFDKLDGSNIRAEWNRKRGWYKFGTRKQMINEGDENFGDAVPIFLNKYGDDLDKVFRKTYPNAMSVVVFGEYVGENSFSGQHEDDDEKDVVLFDVNLYKKGFISPKDFYNNFGHLHIPKLVYKGEYNNDLIKDIQNNIWGLKEGVICKGTRKTKGDELVWMTKIKTKEWLNKVKSLYGEKALLEELNRDRSLLSDCVS